MKFRVPFTKSFESTQALKYIEDVLKNHGTRGGGVYTTKCQDLMQDVFSARRVMLTTSCTSALEMSVLLCGLRPGDEVINYRLRNRGPASVAVRCPRRSPRAQNRAAGSAF